MRPGAGRGSHICTDLAVYLGSKCAASLWDCGADRDSRAHADPGAYLDPGLGAGRDLYACTNLGTYPDHSAGGVLARR